MNTELSISPFTGNVFRRTVPDRLQPLHATVVPKVESPIKPDTRSLSSDLSRILRPQAAYRWLLPQIAAITPQYIEMTLRGALAGNHVQAWELFDLMLDSWPELGACCQELIEGVQRKTLIFEPYHEEDKEAEPEAIERMKVVSAALRNMQPDPAADENDLDGTIKDILSAWFVGQVILEIDWEAPKQTGSLNTVSMEFGDIIAPRSTYWVHPVCYAWNMEGRLGLRTELGQVRTATQTAIATSKDRRSDTGNTTWSSTSYQPRPSSVDDFPDYKFLIGIHKMKSGTALGGARLRLLAWYWCAANFSAEWLLNLAQLFGLPIRWANFDQNAPQETIDGICSMLEKMGSAAWGAFPTGTNLQILDGGAKTSGDHSPQGELLDRADRYARMVILGQTMTGGRGGMGKGGGQAFGAVEKDVKEDRIDAAGKYALGIIEQQLIRYILMVNYGDAANAPTARFLEKEEGSLDDATRDTTLAAGGLKIGVNFLRKKYGIPAPEKDEETIGGAVTAINGKTPAGKGAAGADANLDDKLQKEEDALNSRAADPKPVSSTQLTLSAADALPFLEFAKSIPDSEVYHENGPDGTDDFGLEKDPHITVLFGLTGVALPAVRKAVEESKPIVVTLGSLSLFENDKYDVLKVDVTSDDLIALNANLSALPHDQTHPGYSPHLTIGYLKKGEGKKYAGGSEFEGKQLSFDSLTFSPAKVYRPFLGKPELPFKKAAAEARHRCCDHAAAPLQARDATTEKLLDHVLENLTGVSAKWLGGVKPVFRELLAKAQDSSVTDADLVKAIERARKEMPELFAKLDTKELAQAFERAAGAAVINGVVRAHMERGRSSLATHHSSREVTT